MISISYGVAPKILGVLDRTFRSSLYIVNKQYSEVLQIASPYTLPVSVDLVMESGLVGISISFDMPEPDGGIHIAA